MKLNKILVGGLALGVATASAGLALGADTDASQPSIHSAASTWSTTADSPTSAADEALLAPIAHSLDGDTLVTSSGRTISFGSSKLLAVVPTNAGALCFHADDTSRDGDAVAICGGASGFNPNGIAAVYTTGPAATRLAGPVANDVTAVELKTSDGLTHDLDVSSGAIWWSGPGGSQVDSMTVTRAGEPFVETKLFARQ